LSVANSILRLDRALLMPIYLSPRYYRFWQDDEANHASLKEVTLGTWGQLGVSSEGRSWGFAPHTAHNSLVLGCCPRTSLETLTPFLVVTCRMIQSPYLFRISLLMVLIISPHP
jgi:hypothetical protein